MGLALQYQSFCQHWKIFHLKLMLFGKNKKAGKRDGKKGKKAAFFFFYFLVQRKKNHLNREIASMKKLCSIMCPPRETTANTAQSVI